MNSSELCRQTRRLRSLVGRVRVDVASEPAGPLSPELSRDVARTAREVLAWGTELCDSCAVAAAQEALHVLGRCSRTHSTRLPRTAGWQKKGVVICLHVGHGPDTDSNDLATKLKHRTLSLVLDNRPGFPLHVCVATLSVDDEALTGWLRRYPGTTNPVSTLAPLLVSVLFPAEAATCDDVVSHLTSATTLDGYADVMPPSARAYRAILPVAPGLLTPIQKRCVGGAICGRSRP